MNPKYIIIDSNSCFTCPNDMRDSEAAYRDGTRTITALEAMELKKQGKKVTYPKRVAGYHFYVYKDSCGSWCIFPGRDTTYAGAFSKIPRINNKSLGVVVLADLDQSYPDKALLSVLGHLIQGLCFKFNIDYKKVLPKRYFEKDTTAPGLLFNTKRFIRDYLLEANNNGM